MKEFEERGSDAQLWNENRELMKMGKPERKECEAHILGVSPRFWCCSKYSTDI
jgi:hypothetical protein